MCFRNLPIEFDAQGQARLKPGLADPYTYVERRLGIKSDQERMEGLLEGCDSERQIDVSRATSAAGGVVVDLPALLELVADQGCAPELAVRIVAPLEWEPPTDESSPGTPTEAPPADADPAARPQGPTRCPHPGLTVPR